MSSSFRSGTPRAFIVILKFVSVLNFSDWCKAGEPFGDPERVVEAQLFYSMLTGFPVYGLYQVGWNIAPLAPVGKDGGGLSVVVKSRSIPGGEFPFTSPDGPSMSGVGVEGPGG